MKGVSAIIATILLLMITIGLAGTAYVYISGMMTGKISKAISVLDAGCRANETGGFSVINLVVSNDGTDPIVNTATTADLKVLVDNVERTRNFNNTGAAGSTTYTLAPRAVAILIDANSRYTNNTLHTVLIVSPSNSITHRLWC